MAKRESVAARLERVGSELLADNAFREATDQRNSQEEAGSEISGLVFIHTIANERRWDLSTRMTIDDFREWVFDNAAHQPSEIDVADDVGQVFALLALGLRGIPQFHGDLRQG